MTELLDPPAPCGHDLAAECGDCGDCLGCQPHEHRVEWALRLDVDTLVCASDRAGAENSRQWFPNQDSEIVHRHVTVSGWRADDAHAGSTAVPAHEGGASPPATRPQSLVGSWSPAEVEGFKAIPDRAKGDEVEPWAGLLKPPHPPAVARAAGAISIETGSREQAFRVAYTLWQCGFLSSHSGDENGCGGAQVSVSAVADWLANELEFGVGMHTESPPPWLTVRDLAAAWQRLEGAETVEDWIWTIEAETGWPVVDDNPDHALSVPTSEHTVTVPGYGEAVVAEVAGAWNWHCDRHGCPIGAVCILTVEQAESSARWHLEHEHDPLPADDQRHSDDVATQEVRG